MITIVDKAYLKTCFLPHHKCKWKRKNYTDNNYNTNVTNERFALRYRSYILVGYDCWHISLIDFVSNYDIFHLNLPSPRDYQIRQLVLCQERIFYQHS
mgnify:CR=1 FL=1